MKSRAVFFCAAFIVQASVASSGELDGQLHVPEGFVVEKVAGEPQIRFPMFATFDDRGRLYVAESSGRDLYEELQSQTRRCRVSRLEDRDGDGRFETSQVFADKLVFPMGLCWHDGKLYVADPPNLVTLEDRDGDGRAEQREMILTGFGHTDNGSLHGLTFGPDGLLYMTMGRPDGYRLKRQDGTVLTGTSGALIRCRADGTDPVVLCRGFVNLVELVFTPQGEMIGTDNIFQEPVGGLRDALVDLAPGGLYPLAIDDEGDQQPITGSPLPAISLLPAVAPSGLVRYEGGAWGREFRGQLFSAQHNSRKVQRHLLTRVGSTFTSEQMDFLTSDSPDFHPSDVLQDADGSLLVVDTGGWYVQHCPTGRIRNSRTPGGIYRVRRDDAPRNKAARDNAWGLNVDWARATPRQLCEMLSDQRPMVRHRASLLLRQHNEEAIDSLDAVLQQEQQGNGIQAKQHAIWALAGCTNPSSLEPLRQVLESDDSRLIAAAARALALRRDKKCATRLCELLSASQPQVRRAAAEALARCGQAESVSALLDALTSQPDRFLEHSLIYAVHQLASQQQLLSALGHRHAAVQRCALVLLDQHPHQALASDAVVSRLGATDKALQQTALRILMRHPQWADDAQALLRQWLDASTLTDIQLAALPRIVVAFQARPAVQQLVGAKLSDPKLPRDRLDLLLGAIGQCSLAEPPRSWGEGLARAMRHGDATVRFAAVHAASNLQLPQLDAVFDELAEDEEMPTPLRVEALGAVASRQKAISDTAFDFLLRLLDDRTAPPIRLSAAEVLGRSKLTNAQLNVVLEKTPDDALIWPQLLSAYRQTNDRELGLALVARLERLIETDVLRPSEAEVKKTLQPYPEIVRERGTKLLAMLRRRTGELGERLEEYQSLGQGGDVEGGRKVFFGKQVACSACHRVGSEGGNVGPDLTKIGEVRSVRDLVESIVVPSSTFAQGYESYMVVTNDGRVNSGVLVRQSAEILVLRNSGGQEQRIVKADIEEMARHDASIMPEGLDQKMSREQFRDLLAYLRSLK